MALDWNHTNTQRQEIYTLGVDWDYTVKHRQDKGFTCGINCLCCKMFGLEWLLLPML